MQEEADRLAAGMGMTRAPGVWLLPGPVPPMVWAALGSARVYFPAGLLELARRRRVRRPAGP